MKEQSVKVQMSSVQDAAPIAMMVQIASRYESTIHIDCEKKHVNAKSIMGMMSLVLITGEEITVTCNGSDEEEAMAAMVEYIGGRSK